MKRIAWPIPKHVIGYIDLDGDEVMPSPSGDRKNSHTICDDAEIINLCEDTQNENDLAFKTPRLSENVAPTFRTPITITNSRSASNVNKKNTQITKRVPKKSVKRQNTNLTVALDKCIKNCENIAIPIRNNKLNNAKNLIGVQKSQGFVNVKKKDIEYSKSIEGNDLNIPISNAFTKENPAIVIKNTPETAILIARKEMIRKAEKNVKLKSILKNSTQQGNGKQQNNKIKRGVTKKVQNQNKSSLTKRKEQEYRKLLRSFNTTLKAVNNFREGKKSMTKKLANNSDRANNVAEDIDVNLPNTSNVIPDFDNNLGNQQRKPQTSNTYVADTHDASKYPASNQSTVSSSKTKKRVSFDTVDKIYEIQYNLADEDSKNSTKSTSRVDSENSILDKEKTKENVTGTPENNETLLPKPLAPKQRKNSKFSTLIQDESARMFSPDRLDKPSASRNNITRKTFDFPHEKNNQIIFNQNVTLSVPSDMLPRLNNQACQLKSTVDIRSTTAHVSNEIEITNKNTQKRDVNTTLNNTPYLNSPELLKVLRESELKPTKQRKRAASEAKSSLKGLLETQQPCEPKQNNRYKEALPKHKNNHNTKLKRQTAQNLSNSYRLQSSNSFSPTSSVLLSATDQESMMHFAYPPPPPPAPMCNVLELAPVQVPSNFSQQFGHQQPPVPLHDDISAHHSTKYFQPIPTANNLPILQTPYFFQPSNFPCRELPLNHYTTYDLNHSAGESNGTKCQSDFIQASQGSSNTNKSQPNEVTIPAYQNSRLSPLKKHINNVEQDYKTQSVIDNNIRKLELKKFLDNQVRTPTSNEQNVLITNFESLGNLTNNKGQAETDQIKLMIEFVEYVTEKMVRDNQELLKTGSSNLHQQTLTSLKQSISGDKSPSKPLNRHTLHEKVHNNIKYECNKDCTVKTNESLSNNPKISCEKPSQKLEKEISLKNSSSVTSSEFQSTKTYSNSFNKHFRFDGRILDDINANKKQEIRNEDHKELIGYLTVQEKEINNEFPNKNTKTTNHELSHNKVPLDEKDYTVKNEFNSDGILLNADPCVANPDLDTGLSDKIEKSSHELSHSKVPIDEKDYTAKNEFNSDVILIDDGPYVANPDLNTGLSNKIETSSHELSHSKVPIDEKDYTAKNEFNSDVILIDDGPYVANPDLNTGLSDKIETSSHELSHSKVPLHEKDYTVKNELNSDVILVDDGSYVANPDVNTFLSDTTSSHNITHNKTPLNEIDMEEDFSNDIIIINPTVTHSSTTNDSNSLKDNEIPNENTQISSACASLDLFCDTIQITSNVSAENGTCRDKKNDTDHYINTYDDDTMHLLFNIEALLQIQVERLLR